MTNLYKGKHISVSSQGDRELNNALKELGGKAALRIMRTGAKASAKVYVQQAKISVPVRTGLLRSGISYALERGAKSFEDVVAMIGAIKHPRFSSIAAIIERGRPAFVQRYKRGSGFVERKQPALPPNPFMRRAFDIGKSLSYRAMLEAMNKAIKREVRKLRKGRIR